MTGYSRGAATANLVAGELNNGRKLPKVELAASDMYAFCFESPAGTLESFGAKASVHKNIVNIINLNDFVTKVAPDAKNFEFTRYGRDIELPTKELVGDKQYYLLRDRMLRGLEQIESLDEYVVDDFKWKKLGLSIKLSKNNVKFSVDDNSQKHILKEYLDTVIDTFTAEELLNRNYYVKYHQANMREFIDILLGDSKHTTEVTTLEICKLIVDIKLASIKGKIPYELRQKLGKVLGVEYIADESISSLIELFLEFIVKHPNLSITLFENKKIIMAAHQPEICLAWLRSQDKNYTEPLPILRSRKRMAHSQEKKVYYKTNVIVEGEAFGTILGGGLTQENDKAELYAIPIENGQFDGWYKDGVLISKELECDYTVTGESTLVAKFSANNGAENEK